MRNFILILVIVTISQIAVAQHINVNNTELLEETKFNNVSLGDIMRTKGNLSQMSLLFGNSIIEEQNETAPYLAKDLYNENIYFGFEDDTETGNDYYLAFITVKNNSVVVKVKNLSIRIGDDKSKFGKMTMNPKSSSFNFLDADTGSASLSFEIDQTTNKVTEINFILY
ncbi:MAG: hypothetical protein ACI9YE_003506 [Psychroserpens sp.]|jgi:hypothetical protein